VGRVLSSTLTESLDTYLRQQQAADLLVDRALFQGQLRIGDHTSASARLPPTRAPPRPRAASMIAGPRPRPDMTTIYHWCT